MKFVPRVLVFPLLLSGLLGCSSTSTDIIDDDGTGNERDSGLTYNTPIDPDVCTGNLVPPSGYRQETAYTPLTETNPFDQAAQTARERLAKSICVGQEERCDEALSLVTIWRRGQDTRQACVMAVAKQEEIERFLDGPRAELRDQLQSIGAQIARRMRDEPRDGRPAVILDTIEDHGVNGGPRAEWMHRELLNALAQFPLDVREPPLSWSGLRAQRGQGIIRGELNSLPGASGVLEISWRLHLMDNRQAGLGSIEFPEAILPELDQRVYVPQLPPSSDEVSLHLDSRPGGGLCNGQETELWLETNEPLVVRVLNLYGGGGAGTVIFSSGSDTLPPHQLVSLGKFVAMKTSEIPVERFVVLAAPTLEELGNFAGIDAGSFCRLPGSMSSQMHRGEGFPPEAMPWFYSLDYQLMTTEESCGPAAENLRANTDFLATLPLCW